MFDIQLRPSGEVMMTGRLAASECEAALQFRGRVERARTIDLGRLEYVASSRQRVFLMPQKRPKGARTALRLVRYPAFDQILEISAAPARAGRPHP